jgi:pilus assembly protein CpaE
MAEHSETAEHVIAPVPRITVQAFCETPETAAMIEAAAEDRRMQRARVKVRMGGGAAAIEAFRHAPTPNVIVIEVQGSRSKPIECLDALAEVCDEGTRVLVIGHLNDVTLYRQLLQRGVSDYLMAPVEPLTLIAAISEMFAAAGTKPIGRTIAVYGVRGGIGASTVAHNLAWSVARSQGVPTVIADLDIAFGTASLNFNQDPPQGIAEAVFAPERLDAALVERLLSKCSDNLSLLSAPASLDRTIDLTEPAFDVLIEHLRASVPCLVLDVPHQWNAWTKHVLAASDEILIVAGPDLASLRNAKNLLGALKHGRPNDAPLAAAIPFEPALFGTAANNGQMIAEVQPGSKVAELFNELAAAAIGRVETKRKGGATSLLEPLLAKLNARRKAS